MTRDIFSLTRAELAQFPRGQRYGDPKHRAGLNAMIDQSNRDRRGVGAVTQVAIPRGIPEQSVAGTKGAPVEALEFVSQEHDYLICAPVGDPGGDKVNVAKPPLLRRVPEDDEGNRIRDGLVFTYDGVPGTATTKPEATAPFGFSEKRFIDQNYVARDIVLLVAMATGVRTLPTEEEPDGELIGLQELEAGRAWQRVVEERLVLVAQRGDYLECRRPDGEEILNVAKPHLLQQTPFDGKSRRIGTRIVHYAYQNAVSRTATSFVASSGETLIEIHVIGPEYGSTTGGSGISTDEVRARNVGAATVGVVDRFGNPISWWEIDSQREWRLQANG